MQDGEYIMAEEGGRLFTDGGIRYTDGGGGSGGRSVSFNLPDSNGHGENSIDSNHLTLK